MMKYLSFLMIVLFFSCSKAKEESTPKSTFNGEITLSVFSASELPIKISSNTDEGYFDFEVYKTPFHQNFKAKSGFTFIATTTDAGNPITLIVNEKGNVNKTIQSKQGNSFVKVSNK